MPRVKVFRRYCPRCHIRLCRTIDGLKCWYCERHWKVGISLKRKKDVKYG